MTQPGPLIMLCTDKGSIVQAQLLFWMAELWYCMPVRFICSEMTELELWEFIILFKYLLLIGF